LPEHLSGGQISSLNPLIEESFDPAWHRYCSGVTGFTLQIDDRPVLFSLLDVAEVQVNRCSPQRAANENVMERI